MISDSEKAIREENVMVMVISYSEEEKAKVIREENAMVLSDSEASPEENAMVLSDSKASPEVPVLVDLEDYKIGAMVGKGAFSEVYRAENRITGEIVALKMLRDSDLPTREIEILKRLKHDNIIALKALHISDASNPCLVLEFMDFDLLSLANETTITSEIIKHLMNQLLKALNHLHSQKILHRDIKDANILVDSAHMLKLGDFGSSRDLSEEHSDVDVSTPPGGKINSRLSSIFNMLTDEVITLSYRPPELILGSSQYGPEVDMWSAACVFAGLLGNTHGLPNPIFPGKKKKDQLKLIFELCGTPDETNWPGANDIDSYGLLGSLTACKRRVREVFREFDTEALDLLDKMLVLNPTKRISAGDALCDIYFTGLPSIESSKRKREGDPLEKSPREKRSSPSQISNSSITKQAMDLSPVTEALAVKSFDKIANICDNLMLQVTSEGISFHDDWPYAIHLLGHLYVDDCDSARFLWKTIPSSVKESKPEVVAAWRIGQKLLTRDYAGVYEAIRGYDWSQETKDMVAAFSDVYRKRMFQLLMSAYSTITIRDLALFLGMTEDDATTYVVKNGWIVDTASQMVTVKKQAVKRGQKVDSSKLQRLAEDVFHLEH
ncbi:unnamed protein product [Brassica oleracea]